MRNGLCQRTVDAKARAEAKGMSSLGTVMAIEHSHLECIDRGVRLQLSVHNGDLDHCILGNGRATHTANGAHAAHAVGTVHGNLEIRSGKGAANVQGMRHKLGPLKEVVVERGLPVLGRQVAVDINLLGDEGLQIGQDHHVGALARGDRAHILVHTQALCGVDGRKLQSCHRVASALEHSAQSTVHAALADKCVGMVVVGAQDNQARVDAALKHLREIIRKRKPCRAIASLHVHAHAQLGHHVIGRNALVTSANARSDVCVEAAIGLGDGVVARHALAGLEGLPHLMLGILLTSQDAGEVHHLAQAHNVIPLHGLGNLCRIHVRAAVVKAGHGGHASL